MAVEMNRRSLFKALAGGTACLVSGQELLAKPLVFPPSYPVYGPGYKVIWEAPEPEWMGYKMRGLLWDNENTLYSECRFIVFNTPNGVIECHLYQDRNGKQRSITGTVVRFDGQGVGINPSKYWEHDNKTGFGCLLPGEGFWSSGEVW